jgi:DNA primase
MKKPSAYEPALTLHSVTITHPDRLVFEEGAIIKEKVARYYVAVAPFFPWTSA